MGKDGEDALINKVKEYENIYLLIHTDKTYNQESDKFREYIKSNYPKEGNILDFDIYHIK